MSCPMHDPISDPGGALSRAASPNFVYSVAVESCALGVEEMGCGSVH